MHRARTARKENRMAKYIALETLYSALDYIEKSAIKAIKFVPSDVAEIKRGEWKIVCFFDCDDGTSQMMVKCSVCGNTQGVLTNYCPECGADMRGEQDGLD